MKKFFRFAMVGCCTTALDFGIYAMLVKMFGWPKLGSYALAAVVSLPLSFIGQREWGFRVRRKLTPQALEFLAVTISNATLIEPLMILLVPDAITAKIVAICVGATWNFCWFNRWVFAART